MRSNDEFVFKTRKFCIKNEGIVYQKTRKFGFVNDEFCRHAEEEAEHMDVVRSSRASFVYTCRRLIDLSRMIAGAHGEAGRGRGSRRQAVPRARVCRAAR